MLVTWFKIGDFLKDVQIPPLNFLGSSSHWSNFLSSLFRSISDRRPCLICVSSFMRRMDRGLVEHLEEQAMNWCLYGFLCIFGIQYTYVCMPNVVVQHSDAEKSVRLYVGFPESEADVMSLADKCIVVGCFVCWDYDKLLMETGKYSDNIKVTENWLLSGVDRVL